MADLLGDLAGAIEFSLCTELEWSRLSTELQLFVKNERPDEYAKITERIAEDDHAAEQRQGC